MKRGRGGPRRGVNRRAASIPTTSYFPLSLRERVGVRVAAKRAVLQRRRRCDTLTLPSPGGRGFKSGQRERVQEISEGESVESPHRYWHPRRFPLTLAAIMRSGYSYLPPLAALPPIIQPLLWMILGGITGGIMNVVIREASAELHPLAVAFFRNLFSLIFMVPFIARLGLGSLRTAKIGFFTLRAGVAFISMVTRFIGITLVPLATATALNFTAPLFATVLAPLLLGQRVRARRWSAIAIGLFGGVVILRPFGPFAVNMLILLPSAPTAAMGSITFKFPSRSDSPPTTPPHMVIYLA